MGSELRLGVDIGRVIIDGSSHPDGGDTAFLRGGLAGALRTPPMAGVFDVLPRLVERFGGRAWLVSKCGERVQRRSLAWLDHHDFWRRTGIPRDHVRFCRERPEKAGHCRDLGITDFVDDRVDVHEALRGVVARSYLFGPQPRPHPGWLAWAPDWPAVEDLVTAALPGPRRV
jgi:hypothetical protein